MFVGVIFIDFNFHIIIIFKSFFGFFLAMILKLVNFNNPEKRNSGHVSYCPGSWLPAMLESPPRCCRPRRCPRRHSAPLRRTPPCQSRLTPAKLVFVSPFSACLSAHPGPGMARFSEAALLPPVAGPAGPVPAGRSRLALGQR